MTSIEIQGRKIGPGEPAYIIAELSANHQQSYDRAVRIVEAAKAAGADAIKLQTYTPDTLTIDSSLPCFRIAGNTLWDGRTLHELYSEAYMPWDWQPRLKALADSLGLALFSTPFDASAVKFLERMQVPAYKIASFEAVDLDLIRTVAETGKPVILSTGMASLAEIDDAVQAFRDAGGTQLALLKCTSAYPSAPDAIHLRTIPHMAQAFRAPVGLSDHTTGIAVPVAAVALGACIIEKHFTLSRAEPGPDSTFSLEPAEFQTMVEAVRTAEASLGEVEYEFTKTERASRAFRRSLFVVKDLKKGEALTERHVRSIRPGDGLPPKFRSLALGRRAARDIPRGTPLSWDLMA